jgi:hypothetical protein
MWFVTPHADIFFGRIKMLLAGNRSRLIELREKGNMMKNASVSVCKVMLGIVLCAMVFWLSGCGGYFAHSGETEAEGNRRHLRNLSINQQSLMEDVDRAILADEPSKAAEKKVP